LPPVGVNRLPGAAAVISVSHFQTAVGQSERIRNLILRYKEALLAQVQQTAACNAMHPLEARLARWLLQTVDRADDAYLPLTQEFISQMLAVRRTTVTVVAGKLQQAGLIRYIAVAFRSLTVSSLRRLLATATARSAAAPMQCFSPRRLRRSDLQFSGNGLLIRRVGCARVTRMPTFHFNLSGRTSIEDVEGQNLPSLIEVMQEAVGMAGDLARNRRARDVSGDQVIVTDESGREVFRMPLKGAR
jgi:hypothetical protein